MRYCCVAAKHPKTKKVHYFAYTGLPFGLSNAPLIFHKMMTPIRQYISHFFPCTQYLDDFGIKISYEADTPTDILRPRVTFCAKVFQALGVIVNTKGSLSPMTHPIFLGKLLDMETGTFVTKWDTYEKFFLKLEALRHRHSIPL